MPEWIHIALRSLAAVAIIFLLTRILGKKQISELNFFEYIAGITLGSLAGFISTELEAHFMYGVTAILVWFLIPYVFEFITLKSKRLRGLFEGNGTVFIKEGKVLEDNMKKERYSTDELLEQLRKKNVFNVADVEFAVLETTGELSVLLKKENQPLTPKHLGIKIGPEQETQTVIMDGSIMDEPLATRGLSREWLQTELEKIGVTLENVFLGQVDTYGQLYVDVYDDMLQLPQASQNEMLLATLKKCEADLALYGLSTDNVSVKRMYGEISKKMTQIVESVTPLLQR
ncbi:DUF421 domain-containing protein [Paenibacillus allorhizosphaerae]|uniref:YetF C-terminal domain-containing protein n=1 Tax=Paenibacillus allorhizosphaerae TaxID=2849866 RepID=A0ABM8VSX8_9BACL|nr:DUF421 domain-containing protein [Paenibacillus allorhizosphaerae]CAG7657087.1 hypothetical protein PAECIP111802_06610 [Paenibacillus allorhizosphaerae]